MKRRSILRAGMAMFLEPAGTVQILFTTVAAPDLASGDAIRIAAGKVDLQDTIVASHTIGLYRLGGAVDEDYNLLFGNTTPRFGVISAGAHDVSGDPRFAQPASDDYHLTPGSAAVDAGVDAGVNVDIDGQPRPQGKGFDIGYDELAFFQVRLPAIRR